MKVLVLASGSSGNASIVESGGTRILVDAGTGLAALREKAKGAGLGEGIDAIVITHAHGDHLGECLRLSKKLKVPIWASESTARSDRLAGRENVRVFGAKHPFAIGAITISPTPLPHDCAQVALRFDGGGKSAAIVTDLGEVPPALPGHIASCDVLLIESNHDADLLRWGPYPSSLKRRVASSRGHLSNVQTHELLRRLSPRTHTVVLLHLSSTNNRPALALEVARDALKGKTVALHAAAADDRLLVDAAEPPGAEALPKGSQLSLLAV